MQRASSLSLGLRRICPPGHSTMGRCSGWMVKRLSRVWAQPSVVGIQRAMGMAVAAEKILQPQHVAGAERPDQDGTGLARLQQADTAQDQGAHDALAQHGFLHQHVAQAARAAAQWPRHHRRAVASTSAGRPESCASSPRNLPGPCWTMGSRCETAPPWRTSILPLSTKAKPGGDFAGLHDQGAVGEMADLAEAAQARDVLLVQMRKHLVAAGFEKRGVLCHGRKRTKALSRDRHP